MEKFLLYPVFGMALLTLVVALRMVRQRYRAVAEGGLKPSFFNLNRGGQEPEYLIKTTQHYDNLFETPVLFYVVVLLIHGMKLADSGYVVLAWLYLLARIAHALVHMGRNRLLWRRNVFIVSMLVLYTLWGRLLISVVWG